MNILRGYADAAQRLGVRFAFGVEHHGWQVDGDRVVAARTSIGDVQARIFVNAMGAWSGAPVVPLRRNIAATVPTNAARRIDADDDLGRRLVSPARARRPRAAALAGRSAVRDIWLTWVLRLTHERIPCLVDVPIEDVWSGFYEMSPDGRALLGRSPAVRQRLSRHRLLRPRRHARAGARRVDGGDDRGWEDVDGRRARCGRTMRAPASLARLQQERSTAPVPGATAAGSCLSARARRQRTSSEQQVTPPSAFASSSASTVRTSIPCASSLARVFVKRGRDR